MSVYKLIPTHYIKLHEARPLNAAPPAAPCTPEQFENLKLLLRTSNSKLTSLAQTIRDLRLQLRERDETIAALMASARTSTTTSTTTTVHNKCSVEVHSSRPRVEPQDVIVDVSPDIQVHLKVELVENHAAPPLIKVASTVVSRRPVDPHVAKKQDAAKDVAGDASSRSPPRSPRSPRSAFLAGVTSGLGPVRKHHLQTAASPLYSSLMWRTRQRAKEMGYRFVWSRYGKILVKKDVQSPPMYILDEADLRKMV